MHFTGEYVVLAPREKVWEALNDPAILQVCIDGCESLAWVADNELSAVIRAKVGPLTARFSGKLWLTDVVPSRSYTLNGQGEGVGAGFVKGFASIELSDEGATSCRLRYRCETNIGGVLADVGSKLVQGMADRTAEAFFERFTQRLVVAMAAAETGFADLGASEQEGALFSTLHDGRSLLANWDALLAEADEPAAPASTGNNTALPRPIIPFSDPQLLIIGGGFGLFAVILLLLLVAG